MSDVQGLIQDLVAANHILGHEGLCDAYGHISVRNPDNPETYFLSRSRAPELVTADDILEFNLDNSPVVETDTPIYIERPIHGAVYQARPDVMSVIHNHCHEVLPFAITGTPMRPAIHNSRRLGETVPVWDIRDKFGDTDLLVTTNDQGHDLAATLGGNKAAIMRGHGCTVSGTNIPDAVQTAISMKINAQAIFRAQPMGDIIYLTPGEINASSPGMKTLRGHDRAWEYLLRRAGVSS
ncbi:MAG: class II aldolase/adducin family protein [Rhodospirillales bacterium]|nr:class II aldolase/adducin family protein [Rhodospirillales bacterium]